MPHETNNGSSTQGKGQGWGLCWCCETEIFPLHSSLWWGKKSCHTIADELSQMRREGMEIANSPAQVWQGLILGLASTPCSHKPLAFPITQHNIDLGHSWQLEWPNFWDGKNKKQQQNLTQINPWSNSKEDLSEVKDNYICMEPLPFNLSRFFMIPPSMSYPMSHSLTFPKNKSHSRKTVRCTGHSERNKEFNPTVKCTVNCKKSIKM